MIWALLALLGVPLWLIAAMLAGILTSRRRFKRQEGVFKLATRPAGAATWKRSSTGYARTVSNVLVINVGFALIRTQIHEVERVEIADSDSSPRGFSRPTGRTLRLADGSRLDVVIDAADAGQIDRLAGHSFD